jgi:hypothetical protein
MGPFFDARMPTSGNGQSTQGGTVRTSPRAITAFLVAGLKTESVKVFGNQNTEKIKDNRTARVQPNARQLERTGQLGANARWNALGTPAVLAVLAASAGKPLASGLKR